MKQWARRLTVSLMLAAALAGLAGAVPPAMAGELVTIPSGHEADMRYFEADGRQLNGMAAFTRMPDADLSVWAAGNQFFAMTRVIGDFQAAHPGISVGLITLPPGLVLKAIQAHGWSFGDVRLPMRPDVFETVSVTQLRDTGTIASYIIYMHNALELMVAKGNPRNVVDLHDLTRADLRVLLPNPVTEGIMSFYARPVLQRLGLWASLSPGSDCANCDGTAHVHFTSVHHREIPAGIVGGTADVGLVWRTETLAAIAGGAPVQGVPLPPGQDAADKVAYVAGALQDSPHQAAAAAFIDFIGSPAGQDAYAAFGFLPATSSERTARPLTAN